MKNYININSYFNWVYTFTLDKENRNFRPKTELHVLFIHKKRRKRIDVVTNFSMEYKTYEYSLVRFYGIW